MLMEIGINETNSVIATFQKGHGIIGCQKYRRLDIPSQFVGTPYNQRSFVRLQDISLSYSFPKEIIDKINISNLKVFVSSKNLITWTKWNGSDPETGVGFNPGRPLLKSYTMGLNVQF